MSNNNTVQKRIALISDFSCFGRCALTVSLPILSAFGYECCPIPTAILSSNGAFAGHVMKDTTTFMKDTLNHWNTLNLHFDAIYIGFISSTDQIPVIHDFLKTYKTKDTLVFLDPILGDHGKQYSVTSPNMSKGLQALLPYVDYLTPNLTECCELLQLEYETTETLIVSQLEQNATSDLLLSICKNLGLLGVNHIVVTGIQTKTNSHLINYIYDAIENKSSHTITPKLGQDRSGTGDVFLSILCGKILSSTNITNVVDTTHHTTCVTEIIYHETQLYPHKTSTNNSFEANSLFHQFCDFVAYTCDFVSRVIETSNQQQIPNRNGICFEYFLGELGTNHIPN